MEVFHKVGMEIPYRLTQNIFGDFGMQYHKYYADDMDYDVCLEWQDHSENLSHRRAITGLNTYVYFV